MTTTTDPADSSVRRAYSELESPIRVLAHMAAIARFYVCENTVVRAGHENEDDRMVTAIAHVAEMAEELKALYHAGFDKSIKNTD